MEVVFGKKKRKRNKGLIGPSGVIAPGVEIIELVSHPEEFEGNGEIIEVVQQERDIDLNIPILEVGKEEFARVLRGPGAGGGVEQGSLSQDSDPFNPLPIIEAVSRGRLKRIRDDDQDTLNFPVGHPLWDCSPANLLNFGVPMELEVSELPKCLMLYKGENMHIRLT
ncbi:hypothetical protein DVH24_026835 [Malus domestica]|uniref:Uncharacterized protein n=1 Tax=Malus domestica TaxID=3750 RepID=A0A498K8Y5_MALDO|nr:hypothetical protein DVH24_026835 [Malus domestica]